MYTGTYHRLGVSVYASNLAVIRAARRKIRRSMRRDPSFRTARKDFYRCMITLHADARELVSAFRL